VLRVLQEHKVRRVGSNDFIPIDVRIVAATNKDLSGLIRQDNSRRPLLSFSVVMIQLPSLEERRKTSRSRAAFSGAFISATNAR